MEENFFILLKATTKKGLSKCPALIPDMSKDSQRKNHWYVSMIFRCYIALTTGNISSHHLTEHTCSESQINLLFFLNWHYWYVKVSLNVYFWAPFFILQCLWVMFICHYKFMNEMPLMMHRFHSQNLKVFPHLDVYMFNLCLVLKAEICGKI